MMQNKYLLPSQENYSLSKKDLKRLMKMFDQPKMEDYFKRQKATTDNQQISYFYAKERFQNILFELNDGELSIPKLSSKIEDFLIKQKISEQELKAIKLKAQKQAIINQLELLQQQVSKPKRKRNSHQIKSLDASRTSFSQQNEKNQFQNIEEMPNLNGKLILTKKQHKELVHKIAKQRQQRDKKRSQYLISLAEANKKIKQKQLKQLVQQKQEQRKKKIQQIQQNLKKQKEYHQSLLEQQKKSQKVFQELKNKKFLHQELQEKYYNKIRLPLLQEQKRILKEKRQFAKAYSIDQIKNHQKSYQELRQSSIKKRSQVSQIKPHYHPPQKSTKLQKILEEQKLVEKKKFQDKKQALEEKIHRQQNYVEYLKEKFIPKEDPTKKEQIQKRLQNFTKRRQPELDSKVIGMNYLEEAKRLRKKTHAPSSEYQKQQQALLKGENKTILSDKHKQQRNKNLNSSARFHSDYYQKQRRKKIQKLIYAQDCDQNEKIKQLKMQAEKINEAFQMKQQLLKTGGYNQKIQDEAVELLLSSIQAKMGIIDIYN